jgi:hypothetical protein
VTKQKKRRGGFVVDVTNRRKEEADSWLT